VDDGDRIRIDAAERRMTMLVEEQGRLKQTPQLPLSHLMPAKKLDF
jgi:dihydroxyacid dehydratase/phosphogluconate dehydratase